MTLDLGHLEVLLEVSLMVSEGVCLETSIIELNNTDDSVRVKYPRSDGNFRDVTPEKYLVDRRQCNLLFDKELTVI